ncbi:hypothetical protein [Oerskovia paurometabola]|uniref:hypothetical protein n=1 Tax=Oerskovia paurometabola TaxID=162170 RepID=UPI003442C630
MTDAVALHAAVVAVLSEVRSVTWYDDGVVPANPKADTAGRVYPYAVLYPGVGHRPAEAVAVDAQPGPELAWRTQVTVAAGTRTWCMQAAQLTRARLDHCEIAPGVTLVEVPTGLLVQKDPDVSPLRWFVPLYFRALTP